MKENPASAGRGSDRPASQSKRAIETWIAQGSGEDTVPGRAGGTVFLPAPLLLVPVPPDAAGWLQRFSSCLDLYRRHPFAVRG